MTQEADRKLDVFVRPRSVALVGASPRAGSYPGVLLDFLVGQGFPGPIYPVNPNHTEVGGLRCYGRLTDIPGGADLVLAMVPAGAAGEVAKDAGAAGARGLVVYASGFRETGKAGADIEQQLVGVAREHGVRLMGPNCQGFISFPDVAASFTRSLELVTVRSGHVAYLGQSGAVGGTVLALAQERGIGFRSWHSLGNQADVDLTELGTYLLGDPDVRVLALYVEQLGPLAAFRHMARAAASAGKRVVALRAGTSELGRQAALSHTGAMVPAGRAFELLAEREGLIVVEDVEDLVDALSVLTGPVVPGGPRVGIVTTSGGAGALAVDHCDRVSLAVPELTAETRDRLSGVVPSFGTTRNPVDVTADLFKGAPRAGGPLAQVLAEVAGCGEVDSLLVVVTMVVGERAEALAQDVVIAGQTFGRAMVVVWLAPPSSAPEAMATFRRHRVPVFTRLATATAIVRKALDSTARISAQPAPAAVITAGPILRSLPAGRVLVGGDCAALLDELGVVRPVGRLARSASEAAAAAHALGGAAVVLKVQSPDVPHKTEVGGVRVGVTPGEVEAAFGEMVAAVREAVPGAAVEGVLVEPLVSGGREFLISVVRHGGADGVHVLSVGLGGVETELHRDVVSEVLPVDATTVSAMARRLRNGPLLSGHRGRPALDADGLVNVALRLASAAEAAGPRLAELEINPLLVRQQGAGAVALDALIRMAD